MKQYYLYWTICNGTTGNFIFEEDEENICKNIAKELSKSKKYKNVQIMEGKVYEIEGDK